ncbi:flagellin [Parapedomonas caeni]
MPVISTNTAANTALRYLNANSEAQSTSLAKLSSGSRIQTASDDAAGLAIGTGLSADVAVLEQASVNAQHGEAVLQTADGALANISDILERMKSLAAQALSGAVGTTERAYIDAEYQQLLEEIDDITTSTTFNGTTLLDGTSDFATGTGVDFMVGTSSTDVITVELADVDTTALGISGGDVTDATNATTAMNALDAAIATVSSARANVGATLSRFEYRGDVIATSLENLEAAESTLMDADLAAEQTNFTNAQTLTNAAIAALSQANEMPQKLLDLMR